LPLFPFDLVLPLGIKEETVAVGTGMYVILQDKGGEGEAVYGERPAHGPGGQR
jgi:hypothetical protein